MLSEVASSLYDIRETLRAADFRLRQDDKKAVFVDQETVQRMHEEVGLALTLMAKAGVPTPLEPKED